MFVDLVSYLTGDIAMLRHSCVYLILLFLCGCVHQPTINKSTLVELKHIEELLPFRSCVYTIEPLYHFNWRNSKIVKTNDVNLAMMYLSVKFGYLCKHEGHDAIFVAVKTYLSRIFFSAGPYTSRRRSYSYT